MGTFTKVVIIVLYISFAILTSNIYFCPFQSFSGMGGYIAGSKQLIAFVKSISAGVLFHNSMSPVVCKQILTAFKVIMGEDGTDIGQNKLQKLNENSNYFRQEMIRIGLHVYGDYDSPIIPVLIYFPAKVG